MPNIGTHRTLPYNFIPIYQLGSKNITNKTNGTIKASEIKINSWLNIGLEGKIDNDLTFNNLIISSIGSLNDNEWAKIFISLDQDNSDFLWITDTLSADIDNAFNAGLSVKAGFNNYSGRINIGARSEYNLQGPGLLMGIRGYQLKVTQLGNINNFPVPDSEDVVSSDIPGTINKKLLVYKVNNNFMLRLDGPGTASFKIYLKPVKRPSPPTNLRIVSSSQEMNVLTELQKDQDGKVAVPVLPSPIISISNVLIYNGPDGNGTYLVLAATLISKNNNKENFINYHTYKIETKRFSNINDLL